MVVIAAAVCDKSGKAILSRQFLEISKGRIEGMLSAFPKFLSSDKEHTFIETETARYVYQPMESLYMLLLTTKNSNILEDLDTLHLLVKLVPEYCSNVEESHIKRNAFELLFAIDEVISYGYKEKVNLQQIKQLTEMDSHEERIHELVERNKAREAHEIAKKRQKEIEREKKEMASQGISPYAKPQVTEPYVSHHSDFSERPKSTPVREESKPVSNNAPRKAMQLKKAGATNDYLKQMQQAGEIIAESPKSRAASSNSNSATPKAPEIAEEAIHVTIEEKVALSVTADGKIENFEVKGDLSIKVKDPNFARFRIVHTPADKPLQYRSHPNINKQKLNQNIVELKDASKAFPLNTSLGVLKWRFQSANESDVPLMVSCWPTPSGDSTTVNLEFELKSTNLELNDVQISIPIPEGNAPVVENADGSYEYKHRSSTLIWTIPVIDSSNPSGAMEFAVPFAGSSSAFYPIYIDFKSATPYSQILISSLNNVDNNENMKFSQLVTFSPDHNEYKIDA